MIETFNFLKCIECGLLVNNEFETIDFDKLNYNNNDECIESSDNYLIEEHIVYCRKKYLKAENKNLTLIELGPGSKLSLLISLKNRFNCNAYAIDPLYKRSLKDIEAPGINLIDNFNKLPVINTNTIFIARNSIEYLDSHEFSSLINKLFIEKGLFFLEIQPTHEKDWGSIFTFTEYKAFYTNLAIDKLFKNNQKRIKWISSNYVYGEGRSFISGHVRDQVIDQNVIFHSTLKSLCKQVKIKKANNNVKLWGAGGRGLMFLYNEGKDIVDEVIDSSESRQGLYIPEFGYIKSPSSLNEKDIIILLNSNFTKHILNQINKDCSIYTIDVHI